MPRWSPDGKQLAFFSNRSGKSEIWTIHQDGSGLRQITFTPGKAGAILPVWSPDGTHLAYLVTNDTPHVIDLRKAWTDQSPQVLPRLSKEESFWPVELVYGRPATRRPRRPPQRLVGWHLRVFVRLESL